MSVFSLDETPCCIERYDVFGQRSQSRREFVNHTGLSKSTKSMSALERLSVVHMRPPFQSADSCLIDVCGRLEDLSTDERDEIGYFIDEVEEEQKAQISREETERHYIIHPHAKDVRSHNGTKLFTRYSCVGFVLAAYERIEVKLLSAEDADIPELSWPCLSSLYFDLVDMDKEKKESLGLQGEGPWRVVLPGYLLRSFSRETSEIRNQPYTPQLCDIYYPPLQED